MIRSKSTIQSQIQRELLINHGVSTADRRAALQVARSLQSQLFFYEVEWGDKPLQDGVEDVYMFLDDLEGHSESQREREELPTAVITMLTKCYTSTCSDEDPCYSWVCPRRRVSLQIQIIPIMQIVVVGGPCNGHHTGTRTGSYASCKWTQVPESSAYAIMVGRRLVEHSRPCNSA